MDKLIGQGHQRILTKIWDAYHRANSLQAVQMVVIEGPTGFGKTRVVHEFYRQLAEKQSEPAYWPEALSSGPQTLPPDGWMKLRKRPYPDVFKIPPNAKLEWFWWGLICSQQQNGERAQSLWAGKSQFYTHLKQVGSTRSLGGKTVEAMDLSGIALDILSILQVAVPGAGAVAGANAVRNLFLRFRHWFANAKDKRKRRQGQVQGRAIDSRNAGRDSDIAELARNTLKTSEQVPFVIFVEDAHWADTTLFDFLEKLMTQKHGRVLVLATAWPESGDDIGPKNFRSLLRSGYDWVEESRLELLKLEEMTEPEMQELIRQELDRFCPEGERPSPSLNQAIFDRYGSRPLSVKALFALERIQRRLQQRQLSKSDIERCPTDLESLLREYFDQTPLSVQQVMSLASLGGFEFNQSSVVEAGDELRMLNPGLSLQQSDEPYGLIEVASPNVAEFADLTLHQIAERKSDDFFGVDERRVIINQMVSFAKSLNRSVDSEETCRIGWTIHVSLAEKGLVDKAEAAMSAESLRGLHSRRYSYERSRRYARLALEWTPVQKRRGSDYQDLLSELANLEYVMGAVAEAEQTYSDLIALVEAEQPTEVKTILHCRHMRGVCLKKLGQFEAAIEELGQVLRGRLEFGERLLRDSYNSQYHLTICRRLMGELIEAERENRQLLDDQRVLLGADHEDCLATEIEIGRCMFERGDVRGANDWFADLYLRTEEALGNHPYRWIVLGEQSRTLSKLQLLPQAVEVCERSLSGLSKLLGARHPSSLRQKMYLAHMLAESGQKVRGVSILRQVLDAQESEYGIGDKRVSETRTALALLESFGDSSSTATD